VTASGSERDQHQAEKHNLLSRVRINYNSNDIIFETAERTTDWDWVSSADARKLHLHLLVEQLTPSLSSAAQHQLFVLVISSGTQQGVQQIPNTHATS